MLCRVLGGTLVFEFGRGVRGFVDPLEAIAAGDSRGVRLFGGVGGLPVDGFSGVSIAAEAFSRGLRNMQVYGREERLICHAPGNRPAPSVYLLMAPV